MELPQDPARKDTFDLYGLTEWKVSTFNIETNKNGTKILVGISRIYRTMYCDELIKKHKKLDIQGLNSIFAQTSLSH